ncbi:transcriptional regulator, TrmB [Haloterrigena turkmenica DSM 5511]|uniref:Transcriptional regulator, TrmB n=1 Tax=Haloterrigena turkmenica (strain ATCC 51198 / DSM 5511 / JCM 9101 / NCIMB 13204 / VKM B-1734 / 4k) TaxID=543526 RepID=D2RSR0_HALTV|nr:helix-turn-helix domain-containing protein [Haloterrigena turkmenica]ADB60836.1 transcriptional regulator, TrmB [Haloterrigena turkmenica DSM 5511]
MVSFDEEQAEAEALNRLQDLGLSQYEAQTLINLLRLGTGTTQDITRINGVPRTRVYEATDRLHELGFIDIQHTTPRKFTVISEETIIRMLNTQRENTITELAECLEVIGPAQPQREQFGVWTVTGREAVASRVNEFIADADEQIVYMTVDELLTDDHLDQLQAADDRGVDIYLAGISDDVQDQIQEIIPSAELFETLWEWRDTPAGSLLITDEKTALVSALVNGSSGANEIEETAIWGAGDRNSLVVVLRAIFTWRLNGEQAA